MARSLKQTIERRDRLKAELESIKLSSQIERLKKFQEIKARYDVVKTSRKRKSVTPETTNEDGQLTSYNRLKAISIGRDLERNFSGAKSIQQTPTLTGISKNGLMGNGRKTATVAIIYIFLSSCN